MFDKIKSWFTAEMLVKVGKGAVKYFTAALLAQLTSPTIAAHANSIMAVLAKFGVNVDPVTLVKIGVVSIVGAIIHFVEHRLSLPITDDL